jgi:hypothetical protein
MIKKEMEGTGDIKLLRAVLYKKYLARYKALGRKLEALHDLTVRKLP